MADQLTYWACPEGDARVALCPPILPLLRIFESLAGGVGAGGIDFLGHTGLWEKAEALVERHEREAHGIKAADQPCHAEASR